MIRIKTKATEPKNIDCTMEITMSLGEWRDLQAQLKETYPSWKLSVAIGTLIIQMQENFTEEIDSEER